ncbi:MAG: hypothetical protein RIR70_296, partial [Pseudomonadota bacterium]
MKNIAIIGGGWAGLACAVRLTEVGHRITLFEAAGTLGGRARGLIHEGLRLDNGQHILIGAYTETLALIETIGVSLEAAFLRMPLMLHYPGSLHLATRALPAPLHLLAGLITARGLSLSEKLRLAQGMRHCQQGPCAGEPDISVAALLDRHGQSERLTRLIWEPLCVAALNTPIDIASARRFAAVLSDALARARHHSDFLLPRCD